MRVSDLLDIPDDYQRFTQAQRFIRELEVTQTTAVEIRNRALKQLREGGMTQQALADAIGVSQQRIAGMLARAEEIMNG